MALSISKRLTLFFKKAPFIFQNLADITYARHKALVIVQSPHSRASGITGAVSECHHVQP